ncbi:MAG: MarR family transcriptional regulator [Firmicutes bacterium HGW-Firmicutes-15]|nr:MAG: MarR family transcriptional regulator [Firmicutes bacterium HGW-Firmicutes-15]
MELEQCLNFVLTKAQHNVHQLFKAELAPYGVTPGQYAVLRCLWDENGLTARKLADRLYLDGSTITGILDRMEQRGLVEKLVDPKDRRALQVMLTETGRMLEKPLSQAIINANRKALLSIDEKQAEVLKQMLQNIGTAE